MSKFLWQLCKITPVILGASFIAANSAIAQVAPSSEAEVNPSNSEILDQINGYTLDGQTETMDQVNNVSQLRDVSPGDWAFEALRNLVERYGCIAGYPDSTYRGNKPLTRYEFAAGLNACLQQIERLIAEGASRGDIESLQKLAEEFKAELATLGTRVDKLEERVGFLEDHQFSTTTKLQGEVIFDLAGAFGDEKAIESDNDETDVDGGNVDDNITFSDRVRLNFNSSFYGKDQLRTRLQAANFNSLKNATGTDMARLGFDEGGANNVTIDDLWYKFPIGKFTGYVGAAGLNFDDVFDTVNPYFGSSGTGALSRFARYNSAVYRSTSGAGLGINYKFSDAFNLTLAYLTGDDDASDPTDGSGLFNGDYSAGVQLGVNPNENINLALTYVRSYQPTGEVNLSGSTGSDLAKDPFGGVGTSANRFGAQANVKIGKKFSLGGWFGFVNAQAEEGPDNGDNANVLTWAANLAVLDLGKEGNVLGLTFGQPPRLIDSDSDINADGSKDEDPDTSYLIEAQYRYKVNDNITITPGAYVILNPDHDQDNDTIFVGTIRTTFSF
jgi:hypothetical protein